MAEQKVSATVIKTYYDEKLKKTVLGGTEIEASPERIKTLSEKGLIRAIETSKKTETQSVKG